jgi:hypothetical protein
MCVQLSWNGGASWTSGGSGIKTTGQLTATETTYVLGGTDDEWGENWNVNELSNANLRIRVTNVSNDTSGDFFLDWVAVNVYYGTTPLSQPCLYTEQQAQIAKRPPASRSSPSATASRKRSATSRAPGTAATPPS